MRLAFLFALAIAVITTGCDNRYRYHCQDPKHWGDEDCKPPLCVATQTCPDSLKNPSYESK